jgi:hypothetical protein
LIRYEMTGLEDELLQFREHRPLSAVLAETGAEE